MKADLEMIHPDNRVEYEYWYSTILDLDYDTLVDIALYQQALNKKALFTPRVLTYACPQCAKEVREEACIAEGQYCPYFPSKEVAGELKDVKGS